MNFARISSDKSFDKIQVPISKSYSNRALIIAALREGSTAIQGYSDSDDTKDLIKSLRAIGLKIDINPTQIIVNNSFPECEKDSGCSIHIREGATTLRFLMSFLSLGRRNYRITAKQSLLIRPHDELLKLLGVAGVKVTQLSDSITIQGPIKAKELTVDCSLSTQYASSLLMIQDRANLAIDLKNIMSSKSYIDMTKKLIDEDVLICEPDWSSASYPIAYFATHSGGVITNIFQKDHYQGDSCILDIVRVLNGDYHFTDNGLEIKPICANYLEWDCFDCLDLVPTLVYLIVSMNRGGRLKNLSNLRHKEVDRLEGITKVLDQFGFSYSLNNHDLSINPGQVTLPEHLQVGFDHRLFMMSVLLVKKYGNSLISHPECVSKSFPSFLESF